MQPAHRICLATNLHMRYLSGKLSYRVTGTTQDICKPLEEANWEKYKVLTHPGGAFREAKPEDLEATLNNGQLVRQLNWITSSVQHYGAGQL